MENIFADELGHTMLTALKELGEGINKLSLLERNFSNCENIEEFNVMKIVESAASPENNNNNNHSTPRGFVSSRIKLSSFNTDEDTPPPPPSPPLSSDKQLKEQSQINLNESQNSESYNLNPDHQEDNHNENENDPDNEHKYEQDTILSRENVSVDFYEENNQGENQHHDDSFENEYHLNNDTDSSNNEIIIDDNKEANKHNNNGDEDDDDDDDEEEWENDDDLGYIVIPISEQDFFDMEEEVTFRHTLGRNLSEKHSLDNKSQDHDDAHEFESNSQQSNTSYEHDNELNQSFLKREGGDELPINSSYMMSLDLRAHSPELSTDIIETHDSGEENEFEDENQDQEQDEEQDDLENDLAEVASQLKVNSENFLNKTFNDQTSQSQTQINSVNNNIGTSNRRETEIWGQRKIIGVDGDHRYFDLKIIFEPYRTGFEEDKNFHPTPGTIIAGRYEVAEMLGQAAFSTAWQCVDLQAEGVGNEWVCLKVIKNSKDFFDQSLDEIKLLQYINSKGDPHQHNVLKMIDFFYCKEHLFIVSELLRENLYEFGKYIRESGAKEYFTLPRLKKIMKQILEALVYIHSLNLIHCDIKPENIVIKSYSRCEVKLIDFGSSCFTTDHLTSYIQSRSYRAPEVILGLDYGPGIDIWSLGGVLAEMHTGYVLFQNDSLATMLARIQGILGQYPSYILEQGREVNRYFSSSGVIYERSEDGEGNTSLVLIYPKKTTLRHRLHLPKLEELTDEETKFLDFVGWMLHLDPNKRPNAGQALLHPWFDDVDTIDVSYIDT